MEIVALGVRIT